MEPRLQDRTGERRAPQRLYSPASPPQSSQPPNLRRHRQAGACGAHGLERPFGGLATLDSAHGGIRLRREIDTVELFDDVFQLVRDQLRGLIDTEDFDVGYEMASVAADPRSSAHPSHHRTVARLQRHHELGRRGDAPALAAERGRSLEHLLHDRAVDAGLEVGRHCLGPDLLRPVDDVFAQRAGDGAVDRGRCAMAAVRLHESGDGKTNLDCTRDHRNVQPSMCATHDAMRRISGAESWLTSAWIQTFPVTNRFSLPSSADGT